MRNSQNTVLVVEDEENIRMVIEYNLRMDGFEVYLAEDGVAGLELARQIMPDVILLDWIMPEMNGLEGYNSSYASCRSRRYLLGK